MTSRTQNRRTSTPNSPPAGLLPGELAVEMAEPRRLWMGVPTTLDPAGRKLLIDGDPAVLATKSYVDGANAAQDAVIANKVDKAGDTMTGALVIPLGTALLPSLAFAGDLNTGIYSASADVFNIVTGGASRVSVTTGSFTITTLPLRVSDGSVGGPTYSFSSETNSGLYRVSAGNVSMSVLGAQIMTWAATAVTSTKPVSLPNGTAAAPSLTFAASSTVGLFATGNSVRTTTSGVERLNVTDTAVVVAPTLQVWGGSTYLYGPAGANASIWFRDEASLTQGSLLWNRSNDSMRLIRYNAAGSSPEGDLSILPPPANAANALTFNSQVVWSNGNFPLDIATNAPNTTTRDSLIWDGTKYVPGTGGASVTTDDIAPATPNDGDMWLKTSTGVLYCYYDDSTSQQWIQVSASPQVVDQNYSRKTASRKNLLVNGALNVSQENGNTEGTAPAYYMADQFLAAIVSSTATVFFSRVAAANPGGSQYRLRCRVGTASASLLAGEFMGIAHRLEGLNTQDLAWSTATPKDAVISFGFNGPAGTYGVAIRNFPTLTHAFTANFTITAGQALTDTVQTIKIPAPTGMTTWAVDNTASMDIRFTFAAASNLLAPTTGWQSGNYYGVTGMSNGLAAVQSFQIWDIYFGADPDKTGLAPPFEIEDYATTLVKCQRYWQKSFTLWSGSCTSTVPYTAIGVYAVTPRTTPTVSLVNNSNTGFPATPGTPAFPSGLAMYWEQRTANATSASAAFASSATVSARM